MRQEPRTAFDDPARAPEPALIADIFVVLACASFAAYLLNGYVVHQFLTEFTRLLDKFL